MHLNIIFNNKCILYAIEYRNIPSGVKYKHKERSFTTGLHGVALWETEVNLPWY